MYSCSFLAHNIISTTKAKAKVSSCSFVFSGFSIPSGLDCGFVFVLLKGAGYLLWYIFFSLDFPRVTIGQHNPLRIEEGDTAVLTCDVSCPRVSARGIFALSCLIGYLLKL